MNPIQSALFFCIICCIIGYNLQNSAAILSILLI